MRRRIGSAAAAIACLLILAACTDKKLRDIVVAADKVADTVTIIQKAAVDAESSGALTRDQARAVMQLTIRISQANNQAMGIARDLAKLDEPSRQQLLTILTPIINAVNAGLNDPNINANAGIRASLVTIQTSLNSIGLILAAGN